MGPWALRPGSGRKEASSTQFFCRVQAQLDSLSLCSGETWTKQEWQLRQVRREQGTLWSQPGEAKLGRRPVLSCEPLDVRVQGEGPGVRKPRQGRERARLGEPNWGSWWWLLGQGQSGRGPGQQGAQVQKKSSRVTWGSLPAQRRVWKLKQDSATAGGGKAPARQTWLLRQDSNTRDPVRCQE